MMNKRTRSGRGAGRNPRQHGVREHSDRDEQGRRKSRRTHARKDARDEQDWADFESDSGSEMESEWWPVSGRNQRHASASARRAIEQYEEDRALQQALEDVLH